jgi:hypothetical protein
MKNSELMRSINTLYFRQNNSLILKLTSGQRKSNYNLPERDEFVTKVIRVMIKFNKGVVIRPRPF